MFESTRSYHRKIITKIVHDKNDLLINTMQNSTGKIPDISSDFHSSHSIHVGFEAYVAFLDTFEQYQKFNPTTSNSKFGDLQGVPLYLNLKLGVGEVILGNTEEINNFLEKRERKAKLVKLNEKSRC
jgi:hypothetical protein